MADPQKLAAMLQKMQVPTNDIEYRMWLLQNGVKESGDYDMRGFFNGIKTGDPVATSSINPNDQQMHFPDKWKLPNHAGFSTDSQYFDKATMPNTPTWMGGDLPGGGASWTLRSPNGAIVSAEAPWYANGKRGK